MSQQRGLEVVAFLLIVVAGVFGIFLAFQVPEVYRLVSQWHTRDSYFADVANVCKLLLYGLGVHWCMQTFRSGWSLYTRDHVAQYRPAQQNGQQHQHNQNQQRNQNQGGGQQGQHNGQNRVVQPQQTK